MMMKTVMMKMMTMVMTMVMMMKLTAGISSSADFTYNRVMSDFTQTLLSTDEVRLQQQQQQQQLHTAIVTYMQQLQQQQQQQQHILLSTAELLQQQADSSSSSNISACASDTATLLLGIADRKLWALQFLDADAKPPAGIGWYNLLWLGNFDQCMNASAAPHAAFHGQYCLAQLTLGQATVQLGALLRLGLCFPDSCSGDEAAGVTQILVNAVNDLLQLPANSSLTVLPGATMCHVDNTKLPWTTGAVIVIVCLSMLILLLAAATLYDLAQDWLAPALAVTGSSSDSQREVLVNDDGDDGDGDGVEGDVVGDDDGVDNGVMKEATKTGATSLQANSNAGSVATSNSMATQLLLCFSLRANAKKLLSTERADGTLDCLHGIRFISMTWVILGHTYAFGIQAAGDLKQLMDKEFNDWTFQAILNATVSVDTFFMLSGLLATFLFLRELDRVGGKLRAINWPMYFLHRYWRLTPPYLLVMATYVTLFQYFYNGPLYPQQPGGIDPNCGKYWWRNALYVNNLFKGECMAWSWYLANDMQFHIVAPLFLIPLSLHGPIGLGCIAAGILASMTAAGLHSTSIGQTVLSMTDFDGTYVKPYYRIGAYLVGMAAGYWLHLRQKRNSSSSSSSSSSTNNNNTNSSSSSKHTRLAATVAIGWCLSTAAALGLTYGLYNVLAGRQTISQSAASTINALQRPVWAACVAWVAVACVSGYGGWVNRLLSHPILLPLSRLTYCAYLVHPVIIAVFIVSRRQPFIMDNLTAIYQFIGHLVLSYAVAFVTSLAFESPLMGVERVMRGRR